MKDKKIEFTKEVGLINKYQTKVMVEMKNSVSNKEHRGKARGMVQVLRGPGFNSQLSVTGIQRPLLASTYIVPKQICKAPIHIKTNMQSTHTHKNAFKRETGQSQQRSRYLSSACPKPNN